MIKLLFISILVIFSLSCKEQNDQINEPKKEISSYSESQEKYANNLIGFSCFEGGSQSKSVILFSTLLTNKDYISIRRSLTHKNPAKKYLATIICLKLQEKKLIKLSSEESIQVNKNRRSFDLVNLCSGCTNSEELTIFELFDQDLNPIYDQITWWLNETIK